MKLKMKGSMDHRISKFKKLTEITGKPLMEESILFFMNMPAKYKLGFHKKYPTGSPPENVNIADVYEHACTLAVVMQWNSEYMAQNQNKKHCKSGNSTAVNVRNKGTAVQTKGQSGRTRNEKQKDESLESCGPRQSGETSMYMKADRRTECGKKGWKNKSNPCCPKKGNIVTKNE